MISRELGALLGLIKDVGPESALLVKDPYATWIVTGIKKWEIRSFPCHRRQRICIGLSGSQKLLGEVTIVDSLPMTAAMFREFSMHRVKSFEKIWNKTTKLWAWVLHYPKQYSEPIIYHHPKGAVNWVKLHKHAL